MRGFRLPRRRNDRLGLCEILLFSEDPQSSSRYSSDLHRRSNKPDVMMVMRKRRKPEQDTVSPSSASLTSEEVPFQDQSARQYYPICTACSKPASRIYKSYTPTLIVLVRCSNQECKSVVDPYGDEEYRPGSKNRRSKNSETEIHISGSWMDLVSFHRQVSSL